VTSTVQRLGLLGEPEPADLPDRANLIRAVEVGGEGGSLTLLGPVDGSGEFFVVHQTVLSCDEDGFATYGGATLMAVGRDLSLALPRLNPYWFSMVGLYVAPLFQEAVQTLLEQNPRARPWEDWWRPGLEAERPMRCRYVWPACHMWPDEVPQDGFWVEGNLDQVRQTLGYLPYDHQMQLENAANRPFVMLISRDGHHRYGLPHIVPTEQDDPWPDQSFLPLQEFNLMLIEELQYVPVPDRTEPGVDATEAGDLPPGEQTVVLTTEAAMAYYEVIRRAEGLAQFGATNAPAYPGPPGDTLWRMSQLTWPFQVMRSEPESPRARPQYTVYFVRGQGMEEDLWTLPGDRRERDAIRLSILLRNMYSAGNRDALTQGKMDWFLEIVLPTVKQVNAAWKDAKSSDN
jgi:hypothetical protein